MVPDGHDPQRLMEAFAAFTEASEHLQHRYDALQRRLALLQNEIQTVIEAVPFALWVLGESGDLRFTNRPEGMPGVFLDGPPPWESDAPRGLRHYRDATGRDVYLEQEVRPTEGGRIITLRDVTEAHLRALQATREERLQAMGLMATELAHEIRNPLGSLALFAGMLVEDLKDQPPQSELAVRIQESVQRLNTLVTNTLTFSRDLVPKPEKVDLFGFWEEARAAGRFSESITWSNKIPTQATWLGDPGLLRQVVTNVIQNAARAMAERPASQFLVTAAEEVVEGTRHWHVTAEDNGCGIPPEALARVFDPFFSTFEGGTGLGLAVSHRIILAHGGLLHVESHENSGTKVHLRLPSAD